MTVTASIAAVMPSELAARCLVGGTLTIHAHARRLTEPYGQLRPVRRGPAGPEPHDEVDHGRLARHQLEGAAGDRAEISNYEIVEHWFNVAAERLTGRYGDKPFITWYDDHRDERVELSVTQPPPGPAWWWCRRARRAARAGTDRWAASG